MTEPLSYYDKIAIELYGALPIVRFCGMQLFADPRLPDDRIRFVNPTNGSFSDFPLPK
jgi:hypothetical protein